MWWQLLLGALAAVLAVWLGLLVVLWRNRPEQAGAREALRLLPDVVRLVAGLARDHTLPRGVRARLWLLLGYLATPIDVVPDFIPVVGYVDDAILVAVTLRSVVRRAGPDALTRHWPGTPTGLATVERLAGVRSLNDCDT